MIDFCNVQDLAKIALVLVALYFIFRLLES